MRNGPSLSSADMHPISSWFWIAGFLKRIAFVLLERFFLIVWFLAARGVFNSHFVSIILHAKYWSLSTKVETIFFYSIAVNMFSLKYSWANSSFVSNEWFNLGLFPPDSLIKHSNGMSLRLEWFCADLKNYSKLFLSMLAISPGFSHKLKKMGRNFVALTSCDSLLWGMLLLKINWQLIKNVLTSLNRIAWCTAQLYSWQPAWIKQD